MLPNPFLIVLVWQSTDASCFCINISQVITIIATQNKIASQKLAPVSRKWTWRACCVWHNIYTNKTLIHEPGPLQSLVYSIRKTVLVHTGGVL